MKIRFASRGIAQAIQRGRSSKFDFRNQRLKVVRFRELKRLVEKSLRFRIVRKPIFCQALVEEQATPELRRVGKRRHGFLEQFQPLRQHCLE